MTRPCPCFRSTNAGCPPVKRHITRMLSSPVSGCRSYTVEYLPVLKSISAESLSEVKAGDEIEAGFRLTTASSCRVLRPPISAGKSDSFDCDAEPNEFSLRGSAFDDG